VKGTETGSAFFEVTVPFRQGDPGSKRVPAMTRSIISRDDVARELSVSSRMLLRYEALGLVRVVEEGELVGYEPAQIRRLWTIVTYQRDLGINLAGIEVILRLREQLVDVHRRLGGLAEEMRAVLELDDSPGDVESDE
jgi:MerR family transcriptional regulator/heat shock protein HspR